MLDATVPVEAVSDLKPDLLRCEAESDVTFDGVIRRIGKKHQTNLKFVSVML